MAPIPWGGFGNRLRGAAGKVRRHKDRLTHWISGMFHAGCIERASDRAPRLSPLRPAARGEPIKVPADFKTFTYNKSLECLAGPPKSSPLAGNLIVITERSLDSAGNHRAFLINPKNGGDQVERFSVKRSDDFDVTDCTILPPADLLLLERRYSPARGVAMRIRRIPLSPPQQCWMGAGSFLAKRRSS